MTDSPQFAVTNSATVFENSRLRIEEWAISRNEQPGDYTVVQQGGGKVGSNP